MKHEKGNIFIKMEKDLTKFKISAPGSIVLSGEHSALYEKNIIVAALGLPTNLEFSELPE